MIDVPPFIDGARVLKVADIRGLTPTGRTRHWVDGRLVQDFSRLVIAQYDSSSQVYLFYCDAEWECISDTDHSEIAAAVLQAEMEFGAVEFADVW
ncbi:hypothetical protein VMT65_22860 [Nocardia sp. CDC153]|uniref:hypothetical protein n=1 Tax=Nocardia sp. CDC153 TaxID=3112167 RepID=UPI002DBCE5C1|nr:hypothetical protein [Nocardia sp. CDC153]MEC3955893.1 hypothetical protein [Nocardia sp. CDC153]